MTRYGIAETIRALSFLAMCIFAVSPGLFILGQTRVPS